jgi:hypothetical protein
MQLNFMFLLLGLLFFVTENCQLQIKYYILNIMLFPPLMGGGVIMFHPIPSTSQNFNLFCILYQSCSKIFQSCLLFVVC